MTRTTRRLNSHGTRHHASTLGRAPPSRSVLEPQPLARAGLCACLSASHQPGTAPFQIITKQSELPSMLLLLRVIIYGSILMLWFLASYAVFDWIGVGNAQLDMTNKSVEDIIALFGNLNTSKFPTELSQVLPQAQSMIGAVDLLQHLPDGRLRLALQLRFLFSSESMSHHDLGGHGWLAHRLRRRWSCGRRRCGR